MKEVYIVLTTTSKDKALTSVNGNAFLSYELAKRFIKRQFRKYRKVSESAISSNFAGTQFWYKDLTFIVKKERV